MLPKVANHLLHHTARAISIAQNQTGQTIRNVLQLQSSSTPSTASGNFGAWNGASSSHSNRNGRGTGSGGAKFHPGGRTYSGYTGAGRAVTQAEAASVDDLSQSFGDDSEETPSGLRPSPRGQDTPRSRTSLAVIRSVRAHRPFGPQTALEASSGPGISTQATALLLHRLSAREVSVRLHSTAASAETVSEYLDVESPPASSPSLQPSDAAESPPLSPASSLPSPPVETEEKLPDHESAFFEALQQAAKSRDITKVNQLIKDIASLPGRSSAALYNSALSALVTLQTPDQSLRPIITLYNEMIARSVAPNFRTYTILIRAFTERDRDIRQRVEQLERRVKRQKILGGDSRTELQIIAALRAEDNLRPALLLFQTASAIPHTKIPRTLYHKLLDCCAFHKNVDGAVHVYAHLERSDVQPSARTYELLMRVYMSVADWNAVKAVFDEFRNACESGRIATATLNDDGALRLRYARISVWNSMIESYVRSGQHAAGLGLLEQMLDTKAGDAYNPADVPPPSVSTFCRLIEAFCESGEIDTALLWFNRLLLQDDGPRPPLDASTTPCRPDYYTWITVIQALYTNGRIDNLLEVMASLEQYYIRDNISLAHEEVHVIFQAYFNHLSAHSDLGEAKETLILDNISTLISQFGVHILTFRTKYTDEYDVEGPSAFDGLHEFGIVLPHLLLTRGRPSDAIRFASLYADHQAMKMAQTQVEDAEKSIKQMRHIHNALFTFTSRCREEKTPLSMQQIADVCLLVGRISKSTPPSYHLWCAQRYADIRATTTEPLALSFSAWQTLFRAVARIEGGTVIEDLMEDYTRTGTPMTDIPISNRAYIYLRLVDQKGETQAREIMARYNQDWEEIVKVASTLELPSTEPVGPPSEHAPNPVHVNRVHNNYVAQFYPIGQKGTISALTAYGRFDAGRVKGLYPRPETMGLLIAALGREREFEKLQNVYAAAQLTLQAFENNKEYQSRSWFFIEDQMIIGLAHGGDVNAAHVHRMRIIEHGGVPSADAYGALVHNVKDTTDDTHNAVALFHEARDRGITPNIFLYNTMISKLAKARKADDAISLFQEMKTTGVRPSSVTYGAVIAACCRVGDAASAETLFAEMSDQAAFRPRVPPYNTMMQLYTSTKPDRARALHYFDAMIAAGIQPSAHTYKLLLDAYGSIEPVDTVSRDHVFAQVTSGRKPLVQGTHWASLIHSVGCVQKNIDHALVLFDSITDHPSTRLSGLRLPDAVVFESLIDALAAHRRVDLIPRYVSQLHTHGIHMTAYIANLLIKAYASAGGIERAREIFESLADPPEGIAAPHNHAPHDAVSGGDHLQVPVDAPVYREPSTWEAMVRAELGHCNRDRAVALLERAQTRGFPPAVLHRISGILLDDTVAPWSHQNE